MEYKTLLLNFATEIENSINFETKNGWEFVSMMSIIGSGTCNFVVLMSRMKPSNP